MTRKILERLQRQIAIGRRCGSCTRLEETVLAHGREYIGIERPKGYRHQRARKQCFLNAADAASQGRGQYVEGFAIARASPRMLFQHAWITLDGVHVIDQTLPNALAYEYFGIPFSEGVLRKAQSAREQYGVPERLREKPREALDILGLSTGVQTTAR